MNLSNEKLVEMVLAARDRVATSWCRGALARRAPDPTARFGTVARRGSGVTPTSDEAEAWCMVGALRMEAPFGWRNKRVRDVVQAAFNESGILGARLYPNGVGVPKQIESFNDGHSQEAAIGAFDDLARWLKDTGWEWQG